MRLHHRLRASTCELQRSSAFRRPRAAVRPGATVPGSVRFATGRRDTDPPSCSSGRGRRAMWAPRDGRGALHGRTRRCTSASVLPVGEALQLSVLGCLAANPRADRGRTPPRSAGDCDRGRVRKTAGGQVRGKAARGDGSLRLRIGARERRRLRDPRGAARLPRHDPPARPGADRPARRRDRRARTSTRGTSASCWPSTTSSALPVRGGARRHRHRHADAADGGRGDREGLRPRAP